jgi:hypothetical protein
LHHLELQGKEPGPEDQFACYRHDVISLYENCLQSISSNVSLLNRSDKEVYYSEVKNLIKIIQWNQKRYLQDRDLRKTQPQMSSGGMVIDKGQDSEDEVTHLLGRKTDDGFRYKVDGVFKDLSRRSMMRKQGDMVEGSFYPNLQVLQNLLTIEAI